MLIKLHYALTDALILINSEEIRLAQPATVWHLDKGSIVEMKGQAGKEGEVYQILEDLETIQSLSRRPRVT
jgi:hypothetical protein